MYRAFNQNIRSMININYTTQAQHQNNIVSMSCVCWEDHRFILGCVILRPNFRDTILSSSGESYFPGKAHIAQGGHTINKRRPLLLISVT